MLNINDLNLSFMRYDKRGLTRKKTPILKGLNLCVEKGELVAIIGGSGSGKSLLAHSILGILPENATITGDITFKGKPLTKKRVEKIRGKEIALVPQSLTFLDPLQPVGSQIKKAALRNGFDHKTAKEKLQFAFKKYHLHPSTGNLYPFQLSGGMARRILLATATIGDADLLIADEPTPGLHPDITRETLHHLREHVNLGKSVILISHDLSDVLTICDKIAVFYSGVIVEEAYPSDFTGKGEQLRHPFTRALWNALPENTFNVPPSSSPRLFQEPGCPFIYHCHYETKECIQKIPPYRKFNGGFVRCHHA